MAIKIQNSTIIDDSRNIVNAGITTVTSVSIGNTQVISSARQLQNIASLDATTTATIEAAITNAPNTFTDLQVAGVSTFTNGPVLVGSATSTGTASQRLQVTGGAYVSGNTGIGTTNPTSRLTVSGDVLVSGVITATSFSGNSLTATYTTTAGVATYAGIAGIATYAVTAGVSTYAGVAGVSTFSGYSNTSGFSTFSGYSNTSGFSTFSGYSNRAGIATYAVTAGVATYAGVAGVSTSVIGGIASVTQLNVTGVSTLTAISAGGTIGINQYVLTSTGTGLSWQSVTGIGAITGINIAPDSTNTASYIPFVKISTGTTATQYADTSLVYNSGTQRLGIGTTNPTSKLDVVGDAKFTGVVTATTFSGNATSATQLQTARNFSITGGFVTASAISFDGTGNVALAATITADSIGLGTYTSGDYVKNIFGTANQITVTSGTGEGSTPTLSIPNQFTVPQDITVTRDLQVNRNLNVNGSITIGGTSASLFTTELKISDPDIVLGFRTDANGNDISNDNTSNHGGVALASTEGTPLVQLFIAGIETNPATYKKIMWFKAGTFAGLGTDAWLSNYAVGIGSTQFPVGTRLAAGSVQFTENDLAVVRNINASGIITATTFRGNATSATSATYAGIAGFSTFSGYSNTSGFSTFSGYANNAGIATYTWTAGVSTYAGIAGFSTFSGYSNTSGVSTFSGYANNAGIATYAVTSGVSTYSGVSGVSTSVIGGIASVTQLQVTGISTFSNGPIFVGSATSTGTASQPLQVTGGAYVSGNIGVGTTNPQAKLQVGSATTQSVFITSVGDILSGTNTLYGTGTRTLHISGSNSANGSNSYGSLSLASLANGGNEKIGAIDFYAGNGEQTVQILGQKGNGGPTGTGRLTFRIQNGSPTPLADILDITNSAVTVGTFNGVSSASLNVYNSSSGSSTTGINLGNMKTPSGSNIDINFVDYVGNVYGKVRGVYSGTQQKGDIAFFTADAGTITERVRLNSGGALLVGSASSTGTASQPLQVTGGAYVSGNLGIGNTNPTSRLTVQGDSLITGVSTLGTVQISSGIVTASTVSGIVTYYGDGSKLTGISAGAFNIINQPLTSTTVYPTFAANIGVASVGITSTQVAYIPSSNRLGIGTTNPNYTLEIVGNTRVSGLTSVTNLEIYGTVGAGNTVGNDGQYLKSTGVGVTWASFPTLRTTGIATATQGQTVFNFAYNVGFLDVYVNGVKLTNSEFTAVNGANVTLQSQAFSGDIVEFVSYNTVSTGSGSGGAGSISLDSLTDVVITNPQEGESLGFDGTYWINDYTFTTTTATSSQVPIHTLSSNDYRSVEYMIQVTNGTNYHLTKILVLHNGTTAYNTEYGTISTGPALATFDTDVLGGAIRLLATPYSSSTMTYKIKFTAIKA